MRQSELMNAAVPRARPAFEVLRAGQDGSEHRQCWGSDQVVQHLVRDQGVHPAALSEAL